MEANLVPAGVVNNSFLGTSELSDLLQLFYILMTSSSMHKNIQDYLVSESASILEGNPFMEMLK